MLTPEDIQAHLEMAEEPSHIARHHMRRVAVCTRAGCVRETLAMAHRLPLLGRLRNAHFFAHL